jgi:hypothetical protein
MEIIVTTDTFVGYGVYSNDRYVCGIWRLSSRQIGLWDMEIIVTTDRFVGYEDYRNDR